MMKALLRKGAFLFYKKMVQENAPGNGSLI